MPAPSLHRPFALPQAVDWPTDDFVTMPYISKKPEPPTLAEVALKLGRIVTLHDRASTLHQICYEMRCLCV